MKSRAELYKVLPPNPVIVELGTAEGLFARDMLRDWGASLLYVVDLWDTIPGQAGDGGSPRDWHNSNYKNAMKLFEPYKDKVKVLRGMTWDMAGQVPDDSVDFLYLDACHWPECVQKDLAAWYVKVKKGGIVGGHDWGNPAYGYQPIIEKLCRDNGYQLNIIPEQGPDASFWFVKA